MEKLCLLLALFTACATESEPGPTQEFFTVTEVEVGPDGAKEISRTQITAAERWDLAAGEGRVTQALETESPCNLASVVLWDYAYNVLCIRGTGYMLLSQFIHHWEMETDILGSPHVVPVGWEGLAHFGWTTFVSATFYDANSSVVQAVGPYSYADAFYTYDADGNTVGNPPYSVLIY